MSQKIPAPFRCAKTGDLLYMPVITTDGIQYSYFALFDMFMKAQNQPICVVTQNPIDFFPGVCVALHHYLYDEFKGDTRARGQEDTRLLQEKYGLDMPDISQRPDDDSDEGFMEEMFCIIDNELAYEPCCLSSGSIVSAHNIPEAGFRKDPDRLVACALHYQKPKKSATLEAMIKDRFPRDYADRGREVPPAPTFTDEDRMIKHDPDAEVHIGVGCDGCGIWPIRGPAWVDEDCPENVGFQLCNACYELGYHRRVLTGRFNQTHKPNNRMVPLVQY